MDLFCAGLPLSPFLTARAMPPSARAMPQLSHCPVPGLPYERTVELELARDALYRLKFADVNYVHPAILATLGIYVKKDRIIEHKVRSSSSPKQQPTAVAASSSPQPPKMERRVANDDRLYTLAEFRDWYGISIGDRMWDIATRYGSWKCERE